VIAVLGEGSKGSGCPPPLWIFFEYLKALRCDLVLQNIYIFEVIFFQEIYFSQVHQAGIDDSIFSKMIQQVFVHYGIWISIGTPDTYRRVGDEVFNGIIDHEIRATPMSHHLASHAVHQ